MKYVSITFDDGRSDNYNVAFPIIKKYGLVGTIYCTTGYIDGTWEKSNDWKSSDKAITPDQLKILIDSGWEVGLHGDKHTTSVDDFKVALRKYSNWKIGSQPYGFSMPNSRIQDNKYNDFCNAYLGKEVLYIRTGRRIDTKKLSARLLFACYTYLGVQKAYNLFNNKNVVKTSNIDVRKIYSIVIRNNDNPQMIVKFLEQMPDETWAVLMLHSILPRSDPLFGIDPWNWSSESLEVFCSDLQKLADNGSIRIKTVYDVVNSFGG